MADDGEDTDPGSEVEDAAKGSGQRKKLVFEEDLLFTDDEKEERRLKRLAMSSCCIAEAWNYYSGITNAPRRKNEITTEYDLSMSILYDPTIIQTRGYLKQKYRLVSDGFSKIKEAPYFPYIRPHPPRDLDLPGRRLTMPCVTRVQMPEAFVDYEHPKTISYTGKNIKVYNTMFINDVDTKVASTQVEQGDLQHRHALDKCVQVKDNDYAEFAYEDYPLDDQGNPIGKTTGYCEWCSKEILPIPTKWALRNKWDKSRLYCCKEYQVFIEEAMEYERKILAEIAAKNFLIDIRPHAKRKAGKKGKKDGDADAAAKLAEQKKREREELLKKKKLEKEQAEKAAAARAQNSKTLGVDTFSLPWDPYETWFGHRKYFNDQVFDESIFHCYPHADVILSQSGIYYDAVGDVADSSVTTDYSTPGESPVQSPMRSPVKSPAQSPVKSPAKSPVED